MAKEADLEEIQSAMAEAADIQDGPMIRVLRGILDRQVRLFTRLDQIEEQIDVLRKSPGPATSS